MIAVGLLAIISTTAAAPQVTGDFDGDGAADIAAIVRQPDGARDVIATFQNGRREIVYARVDESAVLSVIPPIEIARLCGPFARAVPDCSRQLSRRDRDGLSFKPSSEELPGLALWTGTRFFLQFSTWQPRPASVTPAGGAVPSPSVVPLRAAQLPCKLKDQRGRLVEVVPQLCEAKTNYVERPVQPSERSLYTVLEMEVGESGKVEKCRVIESSGAPDLDAKACSIVTEKARYKPGSAADTIERQTRRLRITWPSKGELLEVSSR